MLQRGPFQPLYSVKVPDAVKNGDVLQFTIHVVKVNTPLPILDCEEAHCFLECQNIGLHVAL